LRGQIAAGVVGIDPLDKEVLDIRRRRRQTPGDPLIVADENERAARGGPAGDVVLRGFQPGEIPEARRTEIEMRIICEKRLAARGCAFLSRNSSRFISFDCNSGSSSRSNSSGV